MSLSSVLHRVWNSTAISFPLFTSAGWQKPLRISWMKGGDVVNEVPPFPPWNPSHNSAFRFVTVGHVGPPDEQKMPTSNWFPPKIPEPSNWLVGALKIWWQHLKETLPLKGLPMPAPEKQIERAPSRRPWIIYNWSVLSGGGHCQNLFSCEGVVGWQRGSS